MCNIGTWAEFKSEIKKQLYPNNVEEEARAKLRQLQHKGSIQEYVKEFTEVLLEIPDYPDKEAFFSFMDGLQQWAKLEIQRRGAQDLNTAISIAESLIEFKKPEKLKLKDKGGKGKSGGEYHHGRESTHKSDRQKGAKEYKTGERPSLKCFFCEGPHRARECPKKAKLSALIEERENQEREDERVRALQLLNAIKAKVDMPKSEKKGRLFVEAKIGGRTVKTLVDTGATNNFLREDEAKKMGIH